MAEYGPDTPLPVDADLAFWRGEVDRAQRALDPLYPQWDENNDYYKGQSKDATAATTAGSDWINVNVDFYQAEQKASELFFERPDLQLKATPGLIGTTTVAAHRAVMNELLGPDHADVLRTMQKAIKDCLVPSGFGAMKICFKATVKTIPAPTTPGSVLGAQVPLQPDVPVPLHERWVWEHFSPKKFLRPADFHDTDFDKAPWLGMRFRWPLLVARREFDLPPDFTGTATKDEKVLNESEIDERNGLNYVDGIEIWYRAALYDETVWHPELYRCLVLIDGLDRPAKHVDSPYQELDAQGRLTADSMIGSPIHVLTLRDVPDSANVPSDSQMTRPLVREKCKFRTQMLQNRDANRKRILYDSAALSVDTVEKITAGTIGALIPVEGGALAAGPQAIMAPIVTGPDNRADYTAEDYITRDLEKTLALDSGGLGVADGGDETATKTSVAAKSRSVRLAKEQGETLRCYLKGVAKFSALVARYMTPQLAAPYIGQEAAMAWGQWNRKAIDGRMGFTARPDSQIKLDAASERRHKLATYQMVANDPHVNRGALVRDLLEISGYDPAAVYTDQIPEKKPDPNIGWSFKGEDLYNPMVREILAQLGVQISQQTIDEAASQQFKQVALGLRDVSGKAIPPHSQPQPHGGPAEQVRPLSKQQGDKTGERPGPRMEPAA